MPRVLHDLLGNSLEHAHPDRPPRIDVDARRDGDRIVLAVSDNGIGIAPEFAELVFEPCRRLHDGQGRYEGSGIGLSLVRAVIEAHGGTVRLDRDHRDGTRFVLELDAVEPEVFARAA